MEKFQIKIKMFLKGSCIKLVSYKIIFVMNFVRVMNTVIFKHLDTGKFLCSQALSSRPKQNLELILNASIDQ